MAWAGYKVVDAAAKEGFTDVYKQELITLTSDL